MKIPNIFVPEKDLTGTINDYLDDNKDLEKNQNTHIDPNLNEMLACLSVMLRLEGKRGVNIEKIIQKGLKNSEDTRCIHIIDFLTTAENDFPEDVNSTISKHLKEIYAKKIKLNIVNSYFDEKLSIQNSVMDYITMVIGLDSGNLGPNNTWRYLDPKTKLPKTIKIDTNYMRKVEKHLGLNNTNTENFRQTMRKVYAMKISTNPYYDFMDHIGLVEAVTNVKLNSEVAKAGSLIGSLASRTNEENKQVYDRVIDNMIKHHNYCKVCAEKTLEYFCTPR
jgi:serine protein kinase